MFPHIKTQLDCPSWGLLHSQIIQHPSLWNGPSWLSAENSSWTIQNYKQIPSHQLHEVNPAVVPEQNDGSTILEHYSSLTSLQRVTTCCFRFIRNCKEKLDQCIHGLLSSSQLNNGFKVWIKFIQNKNYQDGMSNLKSKMPCKREI